MSVILVYCAGIVTGLLLSIGVAWYAMHKARREFAAKAGVKMLPGETLDAYTSRASQIRAERVCRFFDEDVGRGKYITFGAAADEAKDKVRNARTVSAEELCS